MIYLYENELNELVSGDYCVEVSEDGVNYKKVTVHTAVVGQRFMEVNYVFYERTFNSNFCSLEYSFKKPLFFKIKPTKKFNKCEIRPYFNDFDVKDGVIYFKLNSAQRLSVELDGDIVHNLHIFAEKPLDYTVNNEDKNVVYFGKGVHNAGIINLTDNQTLYLEGGALVYGLIRAKGDNITICGRGIICGAKYPHVVEEHREQLFRSENCKNLVIKDIFMLDSPAYTINLVCSEKVLIDNIKEINWVRNSDGIDVTARDVEIKNCYLRTNDDCISLKAKWAEFSCDPVNINIHDCIFWPDVAHAVLVGPETDPNLNGVYENIVIKDCVVMQQREFIEHFQGALGIFSADNSVIRNVLWENIDILKMDYGRIISILFTDAYATTFGKKITDITYKNISYNGPITYFYKAFGIDKDRTVDNITFENVCICNKKETQDNNCLITNEFVNNVKFK